MIGRAAIGYPWMFREIKHYMQTGEQLPFPGIEERVEVCRTHLHKSIQWKGEILGILEMRRHYTNYLKGFPHIKEYRTRLVTEKTMQQVDAVLDEIKIKFAGIVPERAITTFSQSQLEEYAY